METDPIMTRQEPDRFFQSQDKLVGRLTCKTIAQKSALLQIFLVNISGKYSRKKLFSQFPLHHFPRAQRHQAMLSEFQCGRQ